MSSASCPVDKLRPLIGQNSFDPADPLKWSRQHVEQWLDWAAQEFGLDPIQVSNFPLTGVQLCHLSKEEFVERSPPYTGDVLYSHLTLLRARSGESLCSSFMMVISRIPSR